MSDNIEILRQWIRVVVVITAVCTTTVPIIYAFTRWYKSWLGQMFMLQSVSFAAAMDLTAFFMFWRPKNILIVFWADVVVLTGIAFSTLALAILIFTMNYPRSKGKHHRD